MTWRRKAGCQHGCERKGDKCQKSRPRIRHAVVQRHGEKATGEESSQKRGKEKLQKSGRKRKEKNDDEGRRKQREEPTQEGVGERNAVRCT